MNRLVTKRSDRTARFEPLNGDHYELVSKSDFLERSNHVGTLRYFLLVNKYDLLNRQVASGRICSEEMVQQHGNASKNFDVLIDDFNRHAAYAQKAVCITFCSTAVALAENLHTFFCKRWQTFPNLWVKRLAIQLRSCKVVLLIVRRLCGSAQNSLLAKTVPKEVEGALRKLLSLCQSVLTPGLKIVEWFVCGT